MSATAIDRSIGPSTGDLARRAAPFLLPLVIALGLTAVFAGSGAAGSCAGTGITLADLPEMNAALRGALG